MFVVGSSGRWRSIGGLSRSRFFSFIGSRPMGEFSLVV